MINPNGILKGSGYTATEIVYPIKVLKIDKIYPIIVADLAFIIKICTKFIFIWTSKFYTFKTNFEIFYVLNLAFELGAQNCGINHLIK